MSNNKHSTTEFQGNSFQSITKSSAKLEDEDKDLVKLREKVCKAKLKPPTKFLKDIFGESLTLVAMSKRCGNAPAFLSSEYHGMPYKTECVIKSQQRATNPPKYSYKYYRLFEHNPRNPFVIKLNETVATDDDSEENFVTIHNAKNLSWLVHCISVLNGKHNKNKLVSVFYDHLHLDLFLIC